MENCGFSFSGFYCSLTTLDNRPRSVYILWEHVSSSIDWWIAISHDGNIARVNAKRTISPGHITSVILGKVL